MKDDPKGHFQLIDFVDRNDVNAGVDRGPLVIALHRRVLLVVLGQVDVHHLAVVLVRLVFAVEHLVAPLGQSHALARVAPVLVAQALKRTLLSKARY